MTLPIMRPLYAEPHVIVMDAFMIDKHTILSNLSVTWGTIESSAGYPTTPKPYDNGFRYYGLAIQGREYSDAAENNPKNYWDTLSGAGRMISIRPEDTWETLAAKIGKNGTSTLIHYTPSSYYTLVKVCTVVSRLSVPATYNESDVMPDPLSCSNIPQLPDPAKCDIELIGSNIIDHDTLLDTEVNGHTKTTTMGLRCTKPASVEFRIINNPIDLGHGVTSTITIEGSASPIINVTDLKIVTITSRLSALNPTAGRLDGKVIVVANVQ